VEPLSYKYGMGQPLHLVPTTQDMMVPFYLLRVVEVLLIMKLAPVIGLGKQDTSSKATRQQDHSLPFSFLLACRREEGMLIISDAELHKFNEGEGI
jgi:hypothetical protein